MISRAIIALEAQAVVEQQVKSTNKIRSNPNAITACIMAYQKQLHTETHLKIDPNILKSKKQMLGARQHEIAESFQIDIEQMLFAQEDQKQSLYEYHRHRHNLNCKLIMYMQPTEEKLTTQKNKLLQRITGFTKEIIDNIHDERIIDQTAASNNATYNTLVYKLQECKRCLVSNNYLPDITYFEELFSSDHSYLSIPIILLNALQYLDTLSNHNTMILFKLATGKAQYIAVLHQFIKIIPFALQMIRNWSTSAVEIHVIVVVLYQTIKTLRAVLNVMCALHVEMPNNNKQDSDITVAQSIVAKNSQNPTAENSDCDDCDHTYNSRDKDDYMIKSRSNSTVGRLSSQRSTVDTKPPVIVSIAALFWDTCWGYDYTLTHMATDLILLLKVVRLARLYRTECDFKDEIYCIHGSLPHNIPGSVNHNSYNYTHNVPFSKLLSALQSYANIGSSLATNLLHCCDVVTNLLIHTSYAYTPTSVVPDNTTSSDTPQLPRNIPRIFNSLPHELLVNALDLALICVNQYSVRMGHTGSINSYIIGDTNYIQSCDRESVASINIAVTCFAHSILDTRALAVLRTSFELTVPRSDSFLLMSSFVKCCLAASLYVVNIVTTEEVTVEQLDIMAEKQKEYNVQKKRRQEEEEAWLSSRLKSSPYVIMSETTRPLPTVRGPLQSSFGPTAAAIQSSKQQAPMNKTHVSKHISFSEEMGSDSLIANNKHASSGSMTGTSTKTSSHSVSNGTSSPSSQQFKSSVQIVSTSSVELLSVINVDCKSDYRWTKRSELIMLLNECCLRVMSVMFLHRTSLTIAHTGMIVVRLLTRDLFVKKARLDEYFVMPLGNVLKPLQDIYAYKNKHDDDDYDQPPPSNTNNNNNTDATSSANTSFYSNTGSNNNSYNNLKDLDLPQASSVSTSRGNSPNQKERRPLTSGGSTLSTPLQSYTGGSSRSNKMPSVADYKLQWRVANIAKIMDQYSIYSTADFTFMEVLQYYGENHSQSIEVTEQLLLLVEHIAVKSQLNKYLLLEKGMLTIVQRVRDTQYTNVYIAALSEICIDAMEV